MPPTSPNAVAPPAPIPLPTAAGAGSGAGVAALVAALREDVRALGGPGASAWLGALASSGFRVLATARADRATAAWTPAGTAGRVLRVLARCGVNAGNRLSHILAKSEISCGALEPGIVIGGGHVIIGVRGIGAGTVVHDHVTIGRGVSGDDKPLIGRDVWIGPRCVVYGRIQLGDGVTVLPDSVVSRSIPPGAVVQGNPARVVRRSFDNAPLRRSLGADWASLVAPEHG